MHVSIGAETNAKYRKYSKANNSAIDLDYVLERLQFAISVGISVRIDVPVSRDGTHNYEQMSMLVEKASEIGVERLRFFRLYKTDANKDMYDEIYSDSMVDNIQQGFLSDPNWKVVQRHDIEVFVNQDDTMEIEGDLPIEIVTENCKRRHLGCKQYCQGTYASYFISRPNRIFVRGCHHEFSDNINEYEIPLKLFEDNRLEEIIRILNKAWKWAVRA